MLVQRRGDLAGDEAVRPSGIAFGVAGAVLAFAGVASVVTGLPSAAHGLAPLAGIGDLGTRFGEFSLLLSAGMAAIVAGSILALLRARRLQPVQAGIELMVLGAVVEVCVLAASSRVGYAVDGCVLPAAVACLTGGAAIIAAGVVFIVASIVSARPIR
jgi:hypothetical protein